MRALAFLCVILLSACASNQTPYVLNTRWKEAPQPAPMDYADPAAWSALPSRFDAADLVPRKSTLKDEQANAKAVFVGANPKPGTHVTISLGFAKAGFVNADVMIRDKRDNFKNVISGAQLTTADTATVTE